MRKNELVYYYALDRKWMSTDQANQILRRAEEEGLMSLENGMYAPRFDLAAITIPIGFKPTSAIFERNDPTQVLIGRIIKVTTMMETDVVAEMNTFVLTGRAAESAADELDSSNGTRTSKPNSRVTALASVLGLVSGCMARRLPRF